MDKNKLKVLKSIKYEIRDCCQNCEHGDFEDDEFGYCDEHTYQHLKHSEEESFLSIHRTGYCPDFKRKTGWRMAPLEEFEKHLKKGP